MRKFIIPAVAALAFAASASTGFAADYVRAINSDGTVSISSGRVIAVQPNFGVGYNEYNVQQCLDAINRVANSSNRTRQVNDFCTGVNPNGSSAGGAGIGG